METPSRSGQVGGLFNPGLHPPPLQARPSGESGLIGRADSLLGAGVYGENKQGIGVWGISDGGEAGVYGSGAGADGTGVLGSGYVGVRGETERGAAIYGRTAGAGLAGRFEGD